MSVIESLVSGVQGDDEAERAEGGHANVERIALLGGFRVVDANAFCHASVLDHPDGRYDQIKQEEHGQCTSDCIDLHLFMRGSFV